MSKGDSTPDRTDGILDFQPQDFQQRLNDFFPGIIYVYDAESRKLNYVNKKITDILGYSFDDLKTWENEFSKVVFQDDVALVQEELEKFNGLLDEQSHSYKCRFNRKDGGWLHFQVSGKVLRRDAAGKPASLLLVAQDIEDQLKHQEELKALRELAEDNEELLQFGNWTWDPHTDSLVWSRGMYKLMDYEPESEPKKITMESYLTYLKPEGQEAIRKALEAAQQRKEKTVEFKYAITTPSQNEKVFYSKGKIIYDAQIKTSKIIGTTRDVTQISKYEMELERKITELDHSNRELEDFAYAASHDLQEPLRKISTLSDRLQTKFSEELPDDVKTYLDRIRLSAKNAQTLIDSLMEFSRITHSSLVFDKADLNVLLEGVKSDLEMKIEETGATICSDKLPVMEVSAVQIRQLFTNVLLNSIKFRKEGQPLVIEIKTRKLKPAEVRDRHLDSAIPHVLIMFKDNGIGFEEIYSSIIFHMFSRLHGKSEYPGAGIGLALCKKIAEAHKGQIFAEGIPGQGAVFSLILPETRSNE